MTHKGSHIFWFYLGEIPMMYLLLLHSLHFMLMTNPRGGQTQSNLAKVKDQVAEDSNTRLIPKPRSLYILFKFP